MTSRGGLLAKSADEANKPILRAARQQSEDAADHDGENQQGQRRARENLNERGEGVSHWRCGVSGVDFESAESGGEWVAGFHGLLGRDAASRAVG
jgi:hypothetical protein